MPPKFKKSPGINAAVIGLAITVAVQAGGFIWWAATITTKLDGVMTQLALEQTNRYTRSEAEIAISSLRQRVERLEKMQDKQ